jgi:hypothetical protein
MQNLKESQYFFRSFFDEHHQCTFLGKEFGNRLRKNE